MDDLTKLDQAALVDMLSNCINEYMKLFREGATQNEYRACKNRLDRITREIEARSKKNDQAIDSMHKGKNNSGGIK